MEILKLLFIIILIAVLMWRKVDLGLSLLIGSIILGFLFGMNPKTISLSAFKAITELKTIELIIAVFMIIALGKIMAASGNLKIMVQALDNLTRDPRIAMVIPPALIGLLPAPGGAMLSAPMVDESAKKMNLSPEQKTYLNFWFRHLWEYFWPLYPGLIVAAAILKISVPEMMLVQFPLSLAAIASGVLVGLIPIKVRKNNPLKINNISKAVWNFTLSIWPIWLILIGLMFLHLPILLILGIILTLMLLLLKISWIARCKLLLKSVSWKIALLLISVMIFKQVVMDSSAVQSIPLILSESGVSHLIPLTLIPFLIGLLTGVNQAYVGVAFPLLLPFFGIDEINLKLVMLAYAVGFFGVLLSPVHLCLLLTKEYFNAHWGGIYKLLLPSVILVLIASLALLVL